MSVVTSCAKLIACIAVGGVVSYPIVFISGEEANQLTEKLTVKKKGGPKIYWKNSAKGSSLSLVDIKNLSEQVKKKGDRVTFKEVGMKWGDQPLTEYDILFSPCQDGDYYLMRGNSKSKYTLEDGTPRNVTLRCPEIKDPKYQKLNSVKMKWKSIYRFGSTTPDKIALGSCFFTKKDESSFWITCYEGFDGRRALGDSFYGFVTFDKEN